MIEIREIKPVKAELTRYTQFQIDLYEGNSYFVPPLIGDDVDTLTPSKNPAFDFCKAKIMDGLPRRKTSRENYRNHKQPGKRTLGETRRTLRFTDFIDDDEVADRLFDTVAEWGRSHGMDSMVGPLGFTDLDHEGMLTYGFDEMGTMATIYNYPYYPATCAAWASPKMSSGSNTVYRCPTKCPTNCRELPISCAASTDYAPSNTLQAKNQSRLRTGALRTD